MIIIKAKIIIYIIQIQENIICNLHLHPFITHDPDQEVVITIHTQDRTQIIILIQGQDTIEEVVHLFSEMDLAGEVLITIIN